MLRCVVVCYVAMYCGVVSVVIVVVLFCVEVCWWYDVSSCVVLCCNVLNRVVWFCVVLCCVVYVVVCVRDGV